jgi:hypothetical protein
MQTKYDLNFKNYLDYLQMKEKQDQNEVVNLVERIKQSE